MCIRKGLEEMKLKEGERRVAKQLKIPNWTRYNKGLLIESIVSWAIGEEEEKSRREQLLDLPIKDDRNVGRRGYEV